VLKKLVIRVTANNFCNFLEIVILFPSVPVVAPVFYARVSGCCIRPDLFVVCIIAAGWGKTVTKICFFYGVPKLWEAIIEKQEKMCYNNTDI
jgi:hypothetical protein